MDCRSNEQGREPAFDAIIPAPVRHNDQLCANAKLLYGEIRALSTVHGYCWASNQFFAELYKVTERSVARFIAQLEDLEFISVQILRDGGGHVSGRRIYIGTGFADPEGDILDHMTKMSARLTKLSGQTDKNVSQYNNKNNITKKVRAREDKSEKADPMEELARWAMERFGAEDREELLPHLKDFVSHRNQKKKPLPPGRAVTTLTNKLLRYSGGNVAVMIEMIDKAILYGWDSIYPLKEDELAAILGQGDPAEGGYEKWV